MTSTIIPTLRYRNAPAIINWLCDVFGFSRRMIIEDGEGGVAHAQLVLGGGMVMLGSWRDDDFGRQLRDPRDGSTGCPYLVVTDVDAVHARVAAAGGVVFSPLRDETYGGRGFGCRDLEGHIWYVGSYDPWAETTG